MKARLLYRDRDFAVDAPLPAQAADLTQDLAVDAVLDVMAADDAFVRDIARKVLLASLHDPEQIRYRQRILADCITQAEVVSRLYQVAVSAITQERRVWGFTFRNPEGLLHRSAEVLRIFQEHLRQLRRIADAHRSQFRSDGFGELFAMLTRELDDAYLETMSEHLQRLRWRGGLLMSARLGKGNKGAQYVVRKPFAIRPTLRERIEGWVHRLTGGEASSLTYELDDRDESGFQALQELRNHGIAPVASALAVSTAHILSFFTHLRAELGFYIGCLNLRERLLAKAVPVCVPEPVAANESLLHARGLYDLSLTLGMADPVVRNDVRADNDRLVIITGANRGGKTTFLRSVGLAQLLMQCGAFVPAEKYRAGVCKGIFTHFKRGEDAAMRSGKLDEELTRMSAIVDRLIPGSLVLLNESFASTNEREGSEIARQIVRALLERGVKVMYVTHLFDLAEGFFRAPPGPALFLRAERRPDGGRTFKLLQGGPLPTSFGADVYAHVFGVSAGSGRE